jgi:hypothetical protein
MLDDVVEAVGSACSRREDTFTKAFREDLAAT